MHTRFLFTLALISATSGSAQTTWYVDASNTAPGSGTITDPYVSLTVALRAPTTVSGDTLELASGTYDDESADIGARSLSIRGVGATRPILRGVPGGPMRPTPILTTAGHGASTVRVENVRFEPAGRDVGGAIVAREVALELVECQLCAGCVDFGGGLVEAVRCSVEVRECEWTDASAHSGADGPGLRLVDCTSEVRDGSVHDWGATTPQAGSASAIEVVRGQLFVHSTTFTDNGAIRGGDLRATDARVILHECTASGSRSLEGGSLHLRRGSCEILDCVFQSTNSQDGSGGALYTVDLESLVVFGSTFRQCWNLDEHYGGALRTSGSTTIVGCRFTDNVAGQGGAVYVHDGHCDVRQSTFRANRASQCPYSLSCRGAAIFVQNGSATAERCVFVDNENGPIDGGPGAVAFGGVVLVQCTLIGNRGSVPGAAVHGGSLDSCIVTGSGSSPFAGGVVVAYTLTDTPWPGIGNRTGGASFWSRTDAHLLPDSRAVDAGSPALPSDPDGSRADMGARTFDPFFCGDGCDGAIGTATCTTTPNSTGFAANLSGLGSTDVTRNRLVLNAVRVPVSSVGYALASVDAAFVPNFGGGNGNLCLGGTILRFSGTPVATRPGGVMSFRADLGAFPSGVTVAIGETWNFQLWFRDTSMGSVTSNTTQALRIAFQ